MKIIATKSLSGLRKLIKGHVYDLDKGTAESYVRAGIASFVDEPKPVARLITHPVEINPEAQVIDPPDNIDPVAKIIEPANPKPQKRGRKPRK